MKALLLTTMIIAGSLVASTGYSQVYVRAGVGFGLPAPRVYYTPAPAPAPVAYEDEYGPAPEYAPAPVVDEYPVETYYDLYPNYPAWGGHYRDHVYFDHYRPFFNRYRYDHIREFSGFREHRGNDRGFQRGYDRGRDRGQDRHFDHNRR